MSLGDVLLTFSINVLICYILLLYAVIAIFLPWVIRGPLQFRRIFIDTLYLHYFYFWFILLNHLHLYGNVTNMMLQTPLLKGQGRCMNTW